MKAVVYDRYGPPEVWHVAEVPQPEPKDDEVLIKVHATTVNRFDCHTREANRTSGPAAMVLSRLLSGWRAPRRRILGNEVAGEVVEVGRSVGELKVGDRVFAYTGLGFGCHAEYTCVRESAKIAPIPSAMNYEQAAPMSEGALNALWCLRLANLEKRREVLVYGASGAIGTAGVQLARHFGADVTAVCGTRGLEVVKSLGPREVLDYTEEDFTSNGRTYDVIFDAVGKQTFAHCKASLKPGGAYLATDGLRNVALAMWTSRFGDKKVIFQLPPRWPKADMLFPQGAGREGRVQARDRPHLPDGARRRGGEVCRNAAEDRQRGADGPVATRRICATG